MKKLNALVALALLPAPTFAWNAKGHMVLARLAWRQLPDDQKAKVSAVLKKRPHYAEYLADAGRMVSRRTSGRSCGRRRGPIGSGVSGADRRENGIFSRRDARTSNLARRHSREYRSTLGVR